MVAWWADSVMEFCTAEDVWYKAEGAHRHTVKAVMRTANKDFDKHWCQAQGEIFNLSTDNCNDSGRKLETGALVQKGSNIPWEVVDGDTIYKDPKVVLIKVASKCFVPPLDHLARYFGMVTLLSYTSTWHTFKQSILDRSYISVELLSLTGQGYL